MTERKPSGGSERSTGGGDRNFNKRGGYEAPKKPFKLPKMPSGPAQGGAKPDSGSGTQSSSKD